MTNVVALRKEALPAKAEYAEAINLWCRTRSAAETLTAAEIGAMDGFQRVDAQRKAIILHLAQYYRLHPRSDVAPGVDTVMTLLSDNERGLCTISQGTLAKLFRRSRSSIAEAQVRLRAAGTISESGRGCKGGTYPVIPRVVTLEYNHMTWLIDAICTQDAKPICPAGQDNSELSGRTGHIGELSGRTGHIDTSGRTGHIGELSGRTGHIGGGNVRSDATDMSGHADTTSLSKLSRFQCSHDGPGDDAPGQARDKGVSGTRIAASLAAVISAAVPMAAAASGPPENPPAIRQRTPLPAGLMDKLADAAGPALANAAGCPGLLLMSEPCRWLDSGADLERVILPAIRARCATAKPGSIRSWAYFTQAVADAKASMAAPMPAPSKSLPAPSLDAERAKRRRNYDMGERTSEQYLAQECVAKRRWTKMATHLWGNPEDCAEVLASLGVRSGEWKSWEAA